MDLNNTAIPSINKEDGPKIIAFYKKHGYDTRDLKGTNCKNNNNSLYYYGVNNNSFNNFNDSKIKEYNFRILDISIINGDLDIWI
jgi:hypothetical protein